MSSPGTFLGHGPQILSRSVGPQLSLDELQRTPPRAAEIEVARFVLGVFIAFAARLGSKCSKLSKLDCSCIDPVVEVGAEDLSGLLEEQRTLRDAWAWAWFGLKKFTFSD